MQRHLPRGLSLNVLITCGGGFQGLTLVRALADCPGIRTLVADVRPDNPSRHFADGFRPLPPMAQAIPVLLDICRQDSIGLVLPATDRELVLLAENRAAFEAVGTRVAVSSPALLATVRNKRTLLAALQSQGLPALAETEQFPRIGKPVFGWGGTGVVVARSEADVPPAGVYLWQPLLEQFVEYSADFAIGFDGQLSSVTLRSRLATSGGYAVISETVDRPDLVSVVSRTARWLSQAGGCGIFNVQLLESDGQVVVSDVNPRPGTSSGLSTRVGNNLPLFMAQGRGAGGPPAHGPMRMVRYLDELWFTPGDLSSVQAVVLDLDDTLVIQKQWMMAKLRMLQAGRELPEAFLRTAWLLIEEGQRARLFDDLAAIFGWSREVTLELIETYRTLQPGECPLYPDVLKVLPELRRLGYRLAVCTDNPPASQRQKLASSPLPALLDAVVFTEALGARKPAREGFAAVAEALALPPEALVMVGDHPLRDVQGAVDAGYARAFWLQRPGGFFNFDRTLLAEVLPQPCTPIHRLNDLLAYLHERPG